LFYSVLHIFFSLSWIFSIFARFIKPIKII